MLKCTRCNSEIKGFKKEDSVEISENGMLTACPNCNVPMFYAKEAKEAIVINIDNYEEIIMRALNPGNDPIKLMLAKQTVELSKDRFSGLDKLIKEEDKLKESKTENLNENGFKDLLNKLGLSHGICAEECNSRGACGACIDGLDTEDILKEIVSSIVGDNVKIKKVEFKEGEQPLSFLEFLKKKKKEGDCECPDCRPDLYENEDERLVDTDELIEAVLEGKYMIIYLEEGQKEMAIIDNKEECEKFLAELEEDGCKILLATTLDPIKVKSEITHKLTIIE